MRATCAWILALPLLPALPLLLALSGLLLARSRCAHAEPPAPIEISLTCEPAEPSVGQVFTLVLTVTFERAYLQSQVVQLFRSQLDLPFELRAPLLGEFPNARALGPLEPEEAGTGTSSLVFNSNILHTLVGGVDANGSRGAVILKRRFVALAAQEVALPAPRLRYARATRFEQDVLRGRVPLDREEVEVLGVPGQVRVVPLPKVDQPERFSGYVGELRLEASLDRSEVVVGEPLRLELTLHGDGDLSRLVPPSLSDWPDFHVYGIGDRAVGATRVLTYEIAPLSPKLTHVPPIEIVIFEPSPRREYVSIRTPAIALAVSAGVAQGAKDAAPSQPASPWVAWAWVLGAAIALGLLALLLRRRRAARRAPAQAHPWRADLRARARAASLDPASDPLAVLKECVAALLGGEAGSMIDSGLALRLEGKGLSRQLAERVEQALNEEVTARYQGSMPAAQGVERVAALRGLLEEFAQG